MNKILEFVKKYKVLVLVILIVLFLMGLILILRGSTAPSTRPTPTQPGQTFIPTQIPAQQDFGALEFVRKIPEEDTFTSQWSVEPLTFVFNQPINPNTLEYVISPNIESKIKYELQAPNQFSIIPIQGWDANVKYSITINKVESKVGNNILGPIQTSLTRLADPSTLPDIPDEHSN